MGYKLSYENFLYLALGLISIFIIYKLVTINAKNQNADSDAESDTESDTEEGFQSIINKFKNSTSKSLKTNKKSKSKSKSKFKSVGGKSKLTFDDIVNEAEDMDPGRYTVDSLKDNFYDYIGSFQKEKYKNVTGTTDEALEKLDFFKDKFFEIFH